MKQWLTWLDWKCGTRIEAWEEETAGSTGEAVDTAAVDADSPESVVARMSKFSELIFMNGRFLLSLSVVVLTRGVRRATAELL